MTRLPSCLIHPVVMGNKESYWSGLIVTQALTTIAILVREFILVLMATICTESRKLSFNVQEN